MAILFPFKIIATIIIFLLEAAIKIANLIIVLILSPLEILGFWLRLFFGTMTAVAVIGLILVYLNGEISLMLMIGTLFGCGAIDLILMAPELIMDFLSDKTEDLCFFLDDIREDMWI